MEIVLPPRLGQSETCEQAARERVWRVAEGVVRAGQQFRALLPTLLADHSYEWVYVTADGRHDFFSSQVEAEIAVDDAGIPRNECVVRLVSVLELPDET